jgi:hypothetical protein
MNVSGHRISTTEVESALVSHPKVAEAAVVGATDETTGQGIVAFVILRAGVEGGDDVVSRAAGPRGPRDRPDRQAAAGPGRRRAAQDPVGQDHAPPAAGRGRAPDPRRRHHAGRPHRHGSDDIVIGALVAYSTQPAGPAMVRAVQEVAVFASGQLDLAELDRTRARSAEAEVRVLRAQISPHFVYNSLTAIASFVRTDPDRARDLLLDFADFTRYSFRSHGRFTTLAEELHSIEQYLLLEQARFGDRLTVALRVDPEVVGVRIPFLCIQPLVENAVRHGFENADGPGTITITARDRGADCLISIEDDGAGIDPAVVRRSLSGAPGDHVGLANVDERLRSTFGDDRGLVVETAPGAGTRITMRIPKYAEAVTVDE